MNPKEEKNSHSTTYSTTDWIEEQELVLEALATAGGRALTEYWENAKVIDELYDLRPANITIHNLQTQLDTMATAHMWEINKIAVAYHIVKRHLGGARK